MQLIKSTVQQLSSLAHRVPSINNVSIYEILLFRTKLIFQNPKSTFKLPNNLDGKPIDKRPFVNTLSREKYFTGDDAGRYILGVYSTAWGFYPKRWFTKPLATLKLELNCIAVTDNDSITYPDLYQPETAEAWLKYSFNRQQAFLNELNFTQLDDGGMRADLRSAEEAKAMADQLSLSVETFKINGHVAYRGRAFPNQSEYYIPFTKTDMLQFSFTFMATPAVSEAQKLSFQQHAEVLIKHIIESITLEYPHKQLK